MNRLRTEERGGILVMSALFIPLVFIVLVGLVVDAGTWYTHKRQLQNRADAGALAAGVEYASRWQACGGNATKAQAAGLIDAAARQYAGDPQQAGLLKNTEVTEQARVNVEINSVAPGGSVDPNTSWNDPGGSNLGPCDKGHPTDPFSGPQDYYVNVGVRESNQRSLFGIFGLDLFRNEAHARIQLQTAVAGKGFLPIALPDQDIRQAEIRYYQYCSPSNNPAPPTLLKTVPLRTLARSTRPYLGRRSGGQL